MAVLMAITAVMYSSVYVFPVLCALCTKCSMFPTGQAPQAPAVSPVR